MIKSKPATPEYRNNWDETFGKKEKKGGGVTFERGPWMPTATHEERGPWLLVGTWEWACNRLRSGESVSRESWPPEKFVSGLPEGIEFTLEDRIAEDWVEKIQMNRANFTCYTCQWARCASDHEPCKTCLESTGEFTHYAKAETDGNKS